MFDATIQPPGKPIIQFSVMLNNRSGALAGLLQLLETRHIYCLGVSVQDCHEATIARMVLSDPDEACTLFLEKGIGFTPTELLVISLRHGIEDLNICLDTLSRSEINIGFLYPLFPSKEGTSRLALHVETPDIARSLLNSSGISVLFQEDISR